MSEENSERNKDFELFGLNESYSREQLEREYALLLKRAKYDSTIDVDAIHEAYDRILGIKKPEPVSEQEQKKRNIRMKREENMAFFVIGGILLFFALIIIPSSLSKKAVTLRICFIGNFEIHDRETIKTRLRPDQKSKKTSVGLIYSSSQQGDDSIASAIQAVTWTLLGGDYDLLISDYPMYSFLTLTPGDEMVRDLTDYLEYLGVEYQDCRLVKRGSSIFAIQVDSSSVLDTDVLSVGPYYLSLPNKVLNIDNALDAIKTIMNNDN